MKSYVKIFSFEELTRFTHGFSDKNFIGQTQFGKLYHGKILDQDGMEAQDVTVKIWVDPNPEKYPVDPGDKIKRMQDEVYLLQHAKVYSRPRFVKVIGFCEGEQVGIVYDLKPLNTVSNLAVEESKNFSWLQRIKVAVEFACFLDSLHNSTRGSLVRNICPAHIMLDQEYCPRLIDFGMWSGGVLPDKRDIHGEQLLGCHGYIDLGHAFPGDWSEKCDVFSFAGVLIGLICKRVYNDIDYSDDDFPVMDLYNWADEAYTLEKAVDCFGRSKPSYPHKPQKPGCFGPYKHSLVHKSLKADRGFYSSDGLKISDLLIRCMNDIAMYRPTMNEVVKSLLKLHVVRRHAKELGLKEMVPGCKILDFLPAFDKARTFCIAAGINHH